MNPIRLTNTLLRIHFKPMYYLIKTYVFIKKNKSNHLLDALIYLSKNVINKEIGTLSQILSMYKRISFVH